jgi:hypothetical protein
MKKVLYSFLVIIKVSFIIQNEIELIKSKDIKSQSQKIFNPIVFLVTFFFVGQ